MLRDAETLGRPKFPIALWTDNARETSRYPGAHLPDSILPAGSCHKTSTSGAFLVNLH